MINPKDIDLLLTKDGRKKLHPEFVSENTNCKGDDDPETPKKEIEIDD